MSDRVDAIVSECEDLIAARAWPALERVVLLAEHDVNFAASIDLPCTLAVLCATLRVRKHLPARARFADAVVDRLKEDEPERWERIVRGLV